MSRQVLSLGLFLILVLAGGPAQAQGIPGMSRMNPRAQTDMQAIMLLRQSDVQQELALNPSQIKDIQELIDDLMADLREIAGGSRKGGQNGAFVMQFASADDLESQLKHSGRQMELRVQVARDHTEKLLGNRQSSRLHEISLQAHGSLAIDDPDVMQALKLNAQQKTKLQNLRGQSIVQRQNVTQELLANGGGDLAGLREQMAEVEDTLGGAMLDVLTAPQKTAFEQLKGEPFTGVLTPFGR